MYADTGLRSPYYQSFSLEGPQLDEFWHSQKSIPSMVSTILDYDLGGEGDLFKAPEPIIEEQMLGLDYMPAAISIISGGEYVLSNQALKVADMEFMQKEQLLSEVFSEFKKDLLANEATGTLLEVLNIKNPVSTEVIPTTEEKLLPQGFITKSVSSGCLRSVEQIHGNQLRPTFLDFPGIDVGAVYVMRRAFSEGDIKTLGNNSVSVIHCPLGKPQIMGNCTSEDRREKLSRYRNKKTKRNFGRKIKYACRKALADSQPRIRGRFAKTDESEVFKNNK